MTPEQELFKQRMLQTPNDETIQRIIDQTLAVAPVKMPLYHGTTDAALEGIKKGGLKAKSFVTTSLEVARNHAQDAAAVRGGNPIIMTVDRANKAVKGFLADLSEDYVRNRARMRYRPGQEFGETPKRLTRVAFEALENIPAEAVALYKRLKKW